MPLRPFLLERFFARYEFETPYLLCASDCESMSIDELLGMEPGAREKYMAVPLGYTDSRGGPPLRKEICNLYGSISPEQVLVHSGAEEAVFLFMHAALASGDHVIVHQPCYQSLHEVARSIGCEVTAWQAREENGWSLDPDELRSLVRPRTRAIVLNSPHNPTGFHMKQRVFEETLRFAHELGIIVFSDEVYRGLEYEESARLPAACDLSERALSLGVMSKTYGLAGLRIGWIATRNTAILERMAELKDYTTICCGAASEFLAEVALRHGDAIAERNRRIVLSNLGLLDGFFTRHADRFSWRRPIAGPIAFPRFLHGDVEELCRDAASSSGVLLLPGTVFGDHGNHFRVGFGRMNMPSALRQLEEHLRR